MLNPPRSALGSQLLIYSSEVKQDGTHSGMCRPSCFASASCKASYVPEKAGALRVPGRDSL